MPISKNGTYGDINITDKAIATLIGQAISECYGVVGVAPAKTMDRVNGLLRIEDYGKGISVVNKNNLLTVDVHVILSYGVRISEVVNEIQKRVKYVVENSLNNDVDKVNVHVERIKV